MMSSASERPIKNRLASTPAPNQSFVALRILVDEGGSYLKAPLALTEIKINLLKP